MKTVLISLLLILFSQASMAELKLVNKNQDDPQTFDGYRIDMKTFNEINDSTSGKSQEEVNNDWQAFLSSSLFVSEFKYDYFFKHDSIRYLENKVEGKISLPLLRAMSRIYYEDLHLMAHKAPIAIKGNNLQEIYDNKNFVYNCILKNSTRATPSSDCDDIMKYVALDRADFDKVQSAYIRIVRIGSFTFSHELCEMNEDAYLKEQQRLVTMWINFPAVLHDRANSFFSTDLQRRHYFSLPFTKGKFEGPQFRACNALALWPLGRTQSQEKATP